MLQLRQLPLLLAAASLAVPSATLRCQGPAASRVVVDSAPPPVAREFRAAWVATVGNMDWPTRRGLSTAQQQSEMIAILDKLVALHMNAVVFQVRPAADAFYQSPLEPWSDFLTGVMGRAPSPFYDPLAFATAEAHKRGLEMHVWINPYRARDESTKLVSAGHISRTNPELVRKYGPFLWMDPGDPAVRERTTNVVLDLVRRYDIDAVHMDDYFYPYPEVAHHREIPFPDDATYARYRRAGGTLSRADWRRENVNMLVKELYDGIHMVKPWVRFGISPFGIWRPGYPSSVRGLDQYSVLYADARKWLREGWVDYFTPQLYWSVDKPQQSYVELLRWWSQQNVKGRHLWPGNYTGKVGFTNSAAWRTSEVLRQISLTRAEPGASGNVHFSMSVFMQDPDHLDERLLNEAYAAPALVPASPWLERNSAPPAQPVVNMHYVRGASEHYLDLSPGAGAAAGKAPQPWLWVLQTRTDAGWTTRILPGETRSLLLARGGAPLPSEVRVQAVDRVGVASRPNVLFIAR
jgi:uncharacterized lipoprotein YddW (UPF0748 family)